jgi:hypothetical protein
MSLAQLIESRIVKIKPNGKALMAISVLLAFSLTIGRRLIEFAEG